MIKHIPNAITSANLFCGCLGVVFCYEDQHDMALFLMGLALLFDFFDGFAARMLKVASPIGKELDSLADMVTFGFLPGLMMFKYMLAATCDPAVCTGLISSQYFPFVGFVITIYSALRLAKFNVDERQSDRFYGLPTPANAILIATLPYLKNATPFLTEFISNPKILLTLTLFLAWLLVADLPLIALKFKNFALKENIFRYSLVAGAVLILSVLGLAGVPAIIFFYVSLSVIENFVVKRSEVA